MDALNAGQLSGFEDVIFCVDLSSEMGEMWVESGGGTRLDIVKKSIANFIRLKSALSLCHRFGLCVITDDVSLLLEPTSDIELVFSMVETLAHSPTASSFDFACLFYRIEQVGNRLWQFKVKSR
jgi:hypothetical protein